MRVGPESVDLKLPLFFSKTYTLPIHVFLALSSLVLSANGLKPMKLLLDDWS